MCERMLTTNPVSSVELSYSNDGHFEQLFVAHSISIQGFLRGCRPIIAIDSVHMSEPYGGVLFSTTAYDASDSMFPLAFEVMSSENYEDCLWFLEKWKIVVGNKLLLSQIDILLSFVVFLRCLTFKTMPIATVTWRRILVISCPSITHEGTRVKKMHFNS